MCTNDNKVRDKSIYASGTRVAARSLTVGTRAVETLIVWTEPDGVDYALSFQDPEGCAEVWHFIEEVQRHMNTSGQHGNPTMA